jgi:glycyl-tRNA synthetase beta subunit
LLSGPENDLISYTAEMLSSICQYIPSHYKKVWFNSAYLNIPSNVLTQEEKDKHIAYFEMRHEKTDLLEDIFILIGKRAKNITAD